MKLKCDIMVSNFAFTTNATCAATAWNSHSKLNCIAACIQANKSGVDEVGLYKLTHSSKAFDFKP